VRVTGRVKCGVEWKARELWARVQRSRGKRQRDACSLRHVLRRERCFGQEIHWRRRAQLFFFLGCFRLCLWAAGRLTGMGRLLFIFQPCFFGRGHEGFGKASAPRSLLLVWNPDEKNTRFPFFRYIRLIMYIIYATSHRSRVHHVHVQTCEPFSF